MIGMSNASTDNATILIVDDNPTNISVLLEYLQQNGFKVLVARDGMRAIKQVNKARPDLILLDVVMPGLDGFDTCRLLKENVDTRDIPVIFMTALSDMTDKMNGFAVGAVDYVIKPFQQEEVLARVNTHLTLQKLQQELRETNANLEQRVADRTAELQLLKNRLEAENTYLKEEIKVNHNFEEIIGRSKVMKKALHMVEQVADTDATVLILGETGTGKELIARAVHNLSHRKNRPLVKVNCAALPADLIESELFGHEKGAFTGASNRKAGRFELADNGTIFLDEVGDLPLALQAKLLRALQEGEFERIGATETLKVDVRVIAATNVNLEQRVEKKEFRADLYYRLNVFPLMLPPLRDRSEDTSLLIQHFVKKHAKKLGKHIDKIPQKVMAALEGYSWPGNVRELENVIERALILNQGPTLNLDYAFTNRTQPDNQPASHLTLQTVEKRHIEYMLERTRWCIEGKAGAAVRLGLNPSTLRSRMRKLGIEKPTIEN